MFIIALTGGIEEPSFLPFESLEDLKNSDTYQNIHDFVKEDYGERVDILQLVDGRIVTVESFTE